MSLAGVNSGRHLKEVAGSTEQTIGLILLARANWHMDLIFCMICSWDMYPLFCAISLVPHRMTTTFGLRSMTSSWKRTNIWDETCPLIPLPTKLLSRKKLGTESTQLSVIELPINTTVGRVFKALFWLSYRPNCAQSLPCANVVKEAKIRDRSVNFFIAIEKIQFGDKGTKKNAYIQKKSRKVDFHRDFSRICINVVLFIAVREGFSDLCWWVIFLWISPLVRLLVVGRFR